MKHPLKRYIVLLLCCPALMIAAVWITASLLPSPSEVFPAEWDGNPETLGLLLQENGDGLYVLAVWNDSPAQRAGVSPGDRLTGLNGRGFTSLGELEFLLSSCSPVTGVTLTALRNERPLLLPLLPPQ